MNVMRYTIVDSRGAVSFVAHCDVAFALVAACARNPATLDDLLGHADPWYRGVREYVLNGLAVFDEMNVAGNSAAIRATLEIATPEEQPVFRIVDPVTREASLRPVKAGVIVLNLRAKRIVQIQNSYQEIKRSGRVRLFDGASGRGRTLSYRLPDDWSLVP
jgi:hypothetical protein